MSQPMFRLLCDEEGIFAAVERHCPRDDVRRQSKPDGSWLPKVGSQFPGATSYWTRFGLWKYASSGLKDWHASVLPNRVRVQVARLPEVALYRDDYQVICQASAAEVTEILPLEDFSFDRFLPALGRDYVAVIFSSRRNSEKSDSYAATAERMTARARLQKGFLGEESFRDPDGTGVTISYWDNEESVRMWREDSDHREAQGQGRSDWYDAFALRICRVQRDYDFRKSHQIRPALSFPELFTERLHLRAYAGVSAQALLNYYERNNEHFAPTDPPRPVDFYTAAYWKKRIEAYFKEYGDKTTVRFLLTRPKQEEVIGTVTLSQIARGPFQACYLSYGIDKDFQGQGLMTEAVGAVVKYAFEDLNLHRVMANYLPSNERSGNVLKRLGFEIEGVGRKYLLINGEWQDHVLTSLSNLHWKNNAS